MFSTLSRRMGFSKAKPFVLFDGPESEYFLHYQSSSSGAEGKYKKAYQITGIEKINKDGEHLFGSKGNKLKEVQLFLDNFIEMELPSMKENWFEKYILLVGKQADAINKREIAIQNKFNRYQLSPRIIYHDPDVRGMPIMIIEKCNYDLFDFLTKARSCDGNLLDKVIDLYQFPESLEYIYLDVKPENMIVCRDSPEEDYYLRLIDFSVPYLLNLSRRRNRKELRYLGYKVMLSTFLINTLKFYKDCSEFCNELSAYLNEIITLEDWDIISKSDELNWVLKSYFKRLDKIKKQLSGPTKTFYTKALIYLKSGEGLGKLTRKKKGSYRKSKKKSKSSAKSK
tara:strand:- start:26 stop:1045 length:1020 start_codon:yes stop_codon:yes gene_type:complete